ncbi:MAG: TIGR01777 family oxidoreductase [Dehalococcoidia bacterium]
MLIAMTGSTGLIGSALRDALTRAGHEVRPLRRGTAADGGHYDIASGWVAPEALAGADAVVHLAGASIGTARWTQARRTELVSSRLDSTRALVDAIAKMDARPRVLMVASAIGFYGDAGDRVVDESAAPGTGFLADLVRDWEAEAGRAEALGVRVVSPRFGIVLSKDGGALPQMALPFKFGAGGPIGNGKQWMSWVSLADVTGALLHLLNDEYARGPVNIVAPEPATNRTFARTLGRVMHRPALAPAPAFALRLVLGAGRADELLLASQRVEPKRLRELGYTFQHPQLEEALQAVLHPTSTTTATARPEESR